VRRLTLGEAGGNAQVMRDLLKKSGSRLPQARTLQIGNNLKTDIHTVTRF